jgi:hypothetical protein
MRLARLAAVGLAIGVIAGFAIALLRPRPHAPSTEEHNRSSADRAPVDSTAEEQLWEKFHRAEDKPVVELRSPRRVNG